MIVICIDVIMRYLFSATETWILELEWHLFAILFLIGASYALLHDKHVRVDIFYERFSLRGRNIVNAIGVILFLIPWAWVIISNGWDYMANSWAWGEGSPQPTGLPARWFVKSMIVLGFILLVVQGVSELIKATIRGRN